MEGEGTGLRGGDHRDGPRGRLRRGGPAGNLRQARPQIEKLLAHAPLKGIKTFGDLEKAAGPEKLQVIGTDLAHPRMDVFPQEVKFYVDDDGNPLVPEDFPIADAVRINAGFPEMGEAILDTSMNAFDRFDEKLFGPRTVAIPTGDVETLDFDLSEPEKNELFEFGHQAAKEFFEQNLKGTNLLFDATPTQSAGI